MRWFSRSTSHNQTDTERQAAWSDASRSIGEGQIPIPSSPPAEPGFFGRLIKPLDFRPVETRTVTSLPWSTGGMLSPPSASPGVDQALALGAVYSCVSLLARTVAGLPLHAFREVGGKKTELDQLPQLFDEPSVQGDLFDWIHRCMTSLALYGNAYGLITNRDGYGYPTGIEWLSPEHMTVIDFAFTGPGSFLDPMWRWRGRPIPKENLVHIAWFTRPFKVQGLSPLAAYAAAVNTGLGAQKFSSDWFDAGGVPPGTFKNAQKTVPPTEATEIKQRLVDAIRKHQPIVYGMDWDYNPVAINPQEAQFIETMRLTATQIAAVYGCPPDRVGGEKNSSLTYSTVEQDSIDFVQFTILNYAKKLESAFYKLLPARQYVRFNLDALIRTDLKTRHEVFLLDRKMGLRNIDEIRDMENLPPLPNGQGEDYAPLLATGLAPEEPASSATSGPGSEDSPGSLPQVVNLPTRRPYSDAGANGNGQRTMDWRAQSEPPTVNIYNNVPERPVTVEHHAGDITVQSSPPAEVRLEQPITVQPADVQVPVSITTPEVRIEAPISVQPAAVQIPVTVQPATAPIVKVEAPVTVHTPEIQVKAPDVVVQPAVVNVAMPDPAPPADVEVLDGKGKVISRTRRVKK